MEEGKVVEDQRTTAEALEPLTIISAGLDVIAVKRFRDQCGVPWSVCLSHSCIVLKRQKISSRFFCIRQPPCLSQIVLKFGFGLPFLPKFWPEVTHPVGLSVGDVGWRIAASSGA